MIKNLIGLKKIAILTAVVATMFFSVIAAPAYAFVQSDLDRLTSTKEAP